MRLSTIIARGYLSLIGFTLAIVALCGLLHYGLPPSVLRLPLALQQYAPITFVLCLLLGSSLLLYLKAPLTSRALAMLLLLGASLLLIASLMPAFQHALTTAWPSMALFPPELNTGMLSLFVIAALLLVQHPSVFAESLGSFIGAQVLSLGLLSISVVLCGYTLLTPLHLISLPLGMAFCFVGHSLGFLTYCIYTHALLPPTSGLHRMVDHPYTQQLLAESHIGVWELNLTTQALRADHQTLELYGLDPARYPFTLQDWLNAVVADDRLLLQQTLEQAAHAAEPIDCVFRINVKDQSIRHVRTRAQHLSSSVETNSVLLGISFDVTDVMQQTLSLNQLNAALMQYAYYDSLTGLMNRHAFNDAAERALAEAKRRDFTLAGFFIDLDWFKAINDVHGHLMGDRVLVAVAKRIGRALRAEDLVCRLGGDEFFALLGHIHSSAHARHIATQLIKDIERTIRVDGLELRVGASIGIACFPQDAPSTALLIARADDAMQRAKHLGKGRCACYSE